MRLMTIRVGLKDDSAFEKIKTRIYSSFPVFGNVERVWPKGNEPHLAFDTPYLDLQKTNELLEKIRRWKEVKKADSISPVPTPVPNSP